MCRSFNRKVSAENCKHFSNSETLSGENGLEIVETGQKGREQIIRILTAIWFRYNEFYKQKENIFCLLLHLHFKIDSL
jgi:hypothetical protein